jgi:ADP-heptose:LPS heptosyltransferase
MQAALRQLRRTFVHPITGRVRRLVDAVCLNWYMGGIGDYLMLSTVARELKRRGQGRVYIICGHPELFLHNPDVDGVAAEGSRRHRLYGRLAGDRSLWPTYLINHDRPTDTRDAPPDPVLAYICRSIGMTGRVDLRPYLHLSAQERAWGEPYRGAIVIQSSGMSARWPTPNKEWFPDRMAEVAARLIADHPVVQIGSPKDPAVPFTHDLRGRTTLRQLAALLANCRMFIGLESMQMHMARAVECPSVIVYGGRLRPEEIGYICNENLYTALPCSPCWHEWRCDFDRACLSAITAGDVIAAAGRLLARPREGLAVESYEIAPG